MAYPKTEPIPAPAPPPVETPPPPRTPFQVLSTGASDDYNREGEEIPRELTPEELEQERASEYARNLQHVIEMGTRAEKEYQDSPVYSGLRDVATENIPGAMLGSWASHGWPVEVVLPYQEHTPREWLDLKAAAERTVAIGPELGLQTPEEVYRTVRAAGTTANGWEAGTAYEKLWRQYMNNHVKPDTSGEELLQLQERAELWAKDALTSTRLFGDLYFSDLAIPGEAPEFTAEWADLSPLPREGESAGQAMERTKEAWGQVGSVLERQEHHLPGTSATVEEGPFEYIFRLENTTAAAAKEMFVEAATAREPAKLKDVLGATYNFESFTTDVLENPEWQRQMASDDPKVQAMAVVTALVALGADVVIPTPTMLVGKAARFPREMRVVMRAMENLKNEIKTAPRTDSLLSAYYRAARNAVYEKGAAAAAERSTARRISNFATGKKTEPRAVTTWERHVAGAGRELAQEAAAMAVKTASERLHSQSGNYFKEANPRPDSFEDASRIPDPYTRDLYQQRVLREGASNEDIASFFSYMEKHVLDEADTLKPNLVQRLQGVLRVDDAVSMLEARLETVRGQLQTIKTSAEHHRDNILRLRKSVQDAIASGQPAPDIGAELKRHTDQLKGILSQQKTFSKVEGELQKAIRGAEQYQDQYLQLNKVAYDKMAEQFNAGQPLPSEMRTGAPTPTLADRPVVPPPTLPVEGGPESAKAIESFLSGSTEDALQNLFRSTKEGGTLPEAERKAVAGFLLERLGWKPTDKLKDPLKALERLVEFKKEELAEALDDLSRAYVDGLAANPAINNLVSGPPSTETEAAIARALELLDLQDASPGDVEELKDILRFLPVVSVHNFQDLVGRAVERQRQIRFGGSPAQWNFMSSGEWYSAPGALLRGVQSELLIPVARSQMWKQYVERRLYAIRNYLINGPDFAAWVGGQGVQDAAGLGAAVLKDADAVEKAPTWNAYFRRQVAEWGASESGLSIEHVLSDDLVWVNSSRLAPVIRAAGGQLVVPGAVARAAGAGGRDVAVRARRGVLAATQYQEAFGEVRATTRTGLPARVEKVEPNGDVVVRVVQFERQGSPRTLPTSYTVTVPASEIEFMERGRVVDAGERTARPKTPNELLLVRGVQGTTYTNASALDFFSVRLVPPVNYTSDANFLVETRDLIALLGRNWRSQLRAAGVVPDSAVPFPRLRRMKNISLEGEPSVPGALSLDEWKEALVTAVGHKGEEVTKESGVPYFQFEREFQEAKDFRQILQGKYQLKLPPEADGLPEEARNFISKIFPGGWDTKALVSFFRGEGPLPSLHGDKKVDRDLRTLARVLKRGLKLLGAGENEIKNASRSSEVGVAFAEMGARRERAQEPSDMVLEYLELGDREDAFPRLFSYELVDELPAGAFTTKDHKVEIRAAQDGTYHLVVKRPGTVQEAWETRESVRKAKAVVEPLVSAHLIESTENMPEQTADFLLRGIAAHMPQVEDVFDVERGIRLPSRARPEKFRHDDLAPIEDVLDELRATYFPEEARPLSRDERLRWLQLWAENELLGATDAFPIPELGLQPGESLRFMKTYEVPGQSFGGMGFEGIKDATVQQVHNAGTPFDSLVYGSVGKKTDALYEVLDRKVGVNLMLPLKALADSVAHDGHVVGALPDTRNTKEVVEFLRSLPDRYFTRMLDFEPMRVAAAVRKLSPEVVNFVQRLGVEDVRKVLITLADEYHPKGSLVEVLFANPRSRVQQSFTKEQHLIASFLFGLRYADDVLKLEEPGGVGGLFSALHAYNSTFGDSAKKTPDERLALVLQDRLGGFRKNGLNVQLVEDVGQEGKYVRVVQTSEDTADIFVRIPKTMDNAEWEKTKEAFAKALYVIDPVLDPNAVQRALRSGVFTEYEESLLVRALREGYNNTTVRYDATIDVEVFDTRYQRGVPSNYADHIEDSVLLVEMLYRNRHPQPTYPLTRPILPDELPALRGALAKYAETTGYHAGVGLPGRGMEVGQELRFLPGTSEQGKIREPGSSEAFRHSVRRGYFQKEGAIPGRSDPETLAAALDIPTRQLTSSMKTKAANILENPFTPEEMSAWRKMDQGVEMSDEEYAALESFYGKFNQNLNLGYKSTSEVESLLLTGSGKDIEKLEGFTPEFSFALEERLVEARDELRDEISRSGYPDWKYARVEREFQEGRGPLFRLHQDRSPGVLGWAPGAHFTKEARNTDTLLDQKVKEVQGTVKRPTPPDNMLAPPVLPAIDASGKFNLKAPTTPKMKAEYEERMQRLFYPEPRIGKTASPQDIAAAARDFYTRVKQEHPEVGYTLEDVSKLRTFEEIREANVAAKAQARTAIQQGRDVRLRQLESRAGRTRAQREKELKAQTRQQSIFYQLGLDVANRQTSKELKVYPLSNLYRSLEDAQATARKIAADFGFQYEVFGPTKPPNFRDKNYQNGWVWIYEPGEKQGSFMDEAYTLVWRVSHEVAHALVDAKLTNLYGGPGKRAGALGRETVFKGRTLPPLSLADGLRALEWEVDAFVEQRNILSKYGVHITDEAFNKENSINLADATRRVLTGEFSNPGELGALPSNLNPQNLRRAAFNKLRERALELGLDMAEGFNGNTPAARRAFEDGVLFAREHTAKANLKKLVEKAQGSSPWLDGVRKELNISKVRGLGEPSVASSDVVTALRDMARTTPTGKLAMLKTVESAQKSGLIDANTVTTLNFIINHLPGTVSRNVVLGFIDMQASGVTLTGQKLNTSERLVTLIGIAKPTQADALHLGLVLAHEFFHALWPHIPEALKADLYVAYQTRLSARPGKTTAFESFLKNYGREPETFEEWAAWETSQYVISRKMPLMVAPKARGAVEKSRAALRTLFQAVKDQVETFVKKFFSTKFDPDAVDPAVKQFVDDWFDGKLNLDDAYAKARKEEERLARASRARSSDLQEFEGLSKNKADLKADWETLAGELRSGRQMEQFAEAQVDLAALQRARATVAAGLDDLRAEYALAQGDVQTFESYRKETTKMAEAPPPPPGAYLPPRTPVETKVADRVRALLDAAGKGSTAPETNALLSRLAEGWAVRYGSEIQTADHALQGLLQADLPHGGDAFDLAVQMLQSAGVNVSKVEVVAALRGINPAAIPGRERDLFQRIQQQAERLAIQGSGDPAVVDRVRDILLEQAWKPRGEAVRVPGRHDVERLVLELNARRDQDKKLALGSTQGALHRAAGWFKAWTTKAREHMDASLRLGAKNAIRDIDSRQNKVNDVITKVLRSGKTDFIEQVSKEVPGAVYSWSESLRGGSANQDLVSFLLGSYVNTDHVQLTREQWGLLLETLRNGVIDGHAPEEVAASLYEKTLEILGEHAGLRSREVGDVYFAKYFAVQAIQHQALKEQMGLGAVLDAVHADKVANWNSGSFKADEGLDLVFNILDNPLAYQKLLGKTLEHTEAAMEAHQKPFTQLSVTSRMERAQALADVFEAAGLTSSGKPFVPFGIQRHLLAQLHEVVDLSSSPNVTKNLWKQALTAGILFSNPLHHLGNFFGDIIMTAGTLGFKTAFKGTVASLTSHFLALPGISNIVVGTSGKALEEQSTLRELLTLFSYHPELPRVLEGTGTYTDATGRTWECAELLRVFSREGVPETFEMDQIVRSIGEYLNTEHSYKGRLVRYIRDIAPSLEEPGKAALRMTRLQWDVPRDVAAFIGQRRRVGTSLALLDSGKGLEEAAQLTTKALLNYKHDLHPIDRHWVVELFMPFFAFTKGNARRVVELTLNPLAWDGAVSKTNRLLTSGASLSTEFLDARDEYGMDLSTMSEEERTKWEAFREQLRSAEVSGAEFNRMLRGLPRGGRIDVPVHEKGVQTLFGVHTRYAFEQKMAQEWGPTWDTFIHDHYVPDPSKYALSEFMWHRYTVALGIRRTERARVLMGDNKDTWAYLPMPMSPDIEATQQLFGLAAVGGHLLEMVKKYSMGQPVGFDAQAIGKLAPRLVGDPTRSPLLATTLAVLGKDMYYQGEQVPEEWAVLLPDALVVRERKVYFEEDKRIELTLYKLTPEGQAFMDALLYLGASGVLAAPASYTRVLSSLHDRFPQYTEEEITSNLYWLATVTGPRPRIASTTEQMTRMERGIQQDMKETADPEGKMPFSLEDKQRNELSRMAGEQFYYRAPENLRSQLLARAKEAARNPQIGTPSNILHLQRVVLLVEQGLSPEAVDALSNLQVAERLRLDNPAGPE